MTKIFLNTLGQFYYERVVASAPTNFTDMVSMGMRLEEGVRSGRLAGDIHVKMCEVSLFKHNHASCSVCSTDPRGCVQIWEDVQGLMDRKELVVTRNNEDVCVITPEFNGPERLEISFNSARPEVTPLVICLPGPMPYASPKAIPSRYSATMLEDVREVPMPPPASVENIVDSSRILRSGQVLPTTVQEKPSVPVVKQVQMPEFSKNMQEGQSSKNESSDSDEVLKLIKISEYKIVDQLLQTPSKISMMSLLMNSDAHRNALLKVLEQTYVERDVILGQFEGIVGNITTNNSLSFSDEDLSEEGKNHNLALHISVNCKSDALSNVLIDNGSSLNVMAKTTLDRLSYRGTPMRRSGVVVKAFDGSRKSVIGEVDLPITIGPHTFLITF